MKPGKKFGHAPKSPGRETPRAHIQDALALHQQGRFDDARNLYRELLKHNPANFDALHLSALLAYQTARLDEADQLFAKAIKVKSNFGAAYSNYGLVLHDLKRFEEALSAYDKAISLTPDDVDAYCNRGLVLRDMKRLEDALESCDKAILIKPDHALAYSNRGMVLREMGQLFEAIHSYDLAISIDPACAPAYANRGAALQDADRLDEALACCDKAISLQPRNAESYSIRGNIFRKMKRFDEAVASYEMAIALDPQNSDAYSNRGLSLHDLNRFDDAILSCEKAISIRADHGEAHCNLGVSLQSLRRFEEAIPSFERAISIMPDYADAYFNLGVSLQNLKRSDAAIMAYDKAMSLNRHEVKAHWNKSLVLLGNGDFELGFALYEWRKVQPNPLGDRRFNRPLWLGEENLLGKTILVHEEQGIGDTIQFCRYVNLLAARGAKVIFAVTAKLEKLMGSLGQGVEIRRIDDLPHVFDYHCPLLSLPLAFQTSSASIPAQTPYIHADESTSASLRKRLSENGKRKICGLSWYSKNETTGVSRSVNLLDFFNAVDPREFQFVNLQYGDMSEEIANLKRQKDVEIMNVPEIDNYKDIDGFAALVDACDVIVSIDNTTVHIAGALNKKTFVMLPYIADWRWMQDREDSPWYPSIRLFRQQRDGDWTDVFKRIDRAMLEDAAQVEDHPS